MDILAIQRPQFDPAEVLSSNDEETADERLYEKDDEIQSKVCFEDVLSKANKEGKRHRMHAGKRSAFVITRIYSLC